MGIRQLPFLKSKKGWQVAGGGFPSDGGGGGGGSYTLPTATADRLGGVKIGNGINVDSDGTISVDGGGGAIDLIISSVPQKIGRFFGEDLYIVGISARISGDGTKIGEIGSNSTIVAIYGAVHQYGYAQYRPLNGNSDSQLSPVVNVINDSVGNVTINYAGSALNNGDIRVIILFTRAE